MMLPSRFVPRHYRSTAYPVRRDRPRQYIAQRSGSNPDAFVVIRSVQARASSIHPGRHRQQMAQRDRSQPADFTD